MGKLDAKVALVTGAASGIGRASCLALAAEGARVLVADINEAGGCATVAMLGDAARFQRLNVTSEADWEVATAAAVSAFGRLDILVNCAGIGGSGHVEDIDLVEWNRIIAVNLTGTMLGCKHGIRQMKHFGSNGAIVNLSSVGGLVGAADLAAYCASKGGVTLLSKAVALNCAELGYGIRCNAIHPTYVDTEMLQPVAAMLGGHDAMVAGMVQNVPLGRLATAEDIAKSVVFLASDDASMITGATFLVDGGTTAGMFARHSMNSHLPNPHDRAGGL